MYTYEQLVKMYERRRKGYDTKAAGGRGGEITKKGDDFIWWLYGDALLTMHPDSSITLHLGDRCEDRTVQSRVSQYFYAGYLSSDRTRHRNKLQPVRLYNWKSNTRYDHPYVDGVHIAADGDILNPEILVDSERVRTTSSEATVEIKRKTAKLRKVANVMLRLGAIEPPTWQTARYASADDIDLENPTADDVVALVQLGHRRTRVRWREDDATYLKRVLANGLKTLREDYYEAKNAYTYEVRNAA